MEYKIINNIIHCRSDKNSDFRQCTIEEATALLNIIQADLTSTIDKYDALVVKYNNLKNQSNALNSGILEAMEMGGIKSYSMCK